MFIMPPSWERLSPFHDDRIAFEIGMNVCEKQARIAVFAAIRRAAASAREWDSLGDHLQADYAHKIAEEIRHTIRVALGSEKA